MSASSNPECYLCGAHNEPDASFCERCNGQILRIPDVEDDNPEEEIATPDPEETVEPDSRDAEAKPKMRRTRKGNIQDQRLSEALGLTDDVVEVEIDDKNEGSLVDTVVTSIPRATTSASIPLLGTRAGVVTQSSLDRGGTGKRTYVLLALLLLFTGWFGYNTLTREPNQPDSIAFVSTTTLPATTTTTTEVPERQWRTNEVEGRYKSSFAIVHYYNCSVELEPGQAVRDSIGTGNGIVATTHNVIVDAAPAGADVAEIQSRTGQRRVAILDRTVDGVIVATSSRPTSRNLDVTEPVTEPAAFFLGYDPDTNIVTTTENSSPEAISEIRITSVGTVNSARVGDKDYPSTTFVGIDLRYEVDPEAAAIPGAVSPCTKASVLRRVVAEGDELQEAQIDVSDPTSPDDANGTVDDEE